MAPDNERITQEVDSRLDDLFGDGDDTPDGEKTDGIPLHDDDADSGRGSNPEIDNRLNDFFESDAGASGSASAENARNEDQLRIEELKSVVLSLEWEITDQVMQKLGEEISKLEDFYRDDKIVVAFLQLLGSLGKYIRKKRAEAHPDSITLLQSVYENLEKIVRSSDMSEADKKKMLVVQVNNYKKLKDEIIVSRPTETPVPQRRQEPEAVEPEEAPIEMEAEEEDYEEEEAYDEDVSLEPDEDVARHFYDEADQADAIARHKELLNAIEAMRHSIEKGFDSLINELRSQNRG